MLKILLVISVLLPSTGFGQGSKAEAREEWAKVRPEVIRQGQLLHKAKLTSVGGFFAYYLEKGHKTFSKEHGREQMSELYIDSQFIYFGHFTDSYMIRFMKVAREDLAGLNYNEIDGDSIRARFLAEVVPEKDKQHVAKKDQHCTAGYIGTRFKYNYLPDTREVDISYTWKVGCDFLYKIINKTYTARYNFASGTFSELSVVNHKK